MISIIVPVYNVEKFLPKCIDSLVNQTFRDIEIIFVNDGSTDNSLQVINDAALKDDRIIVFSQENKGQGAAKNYALSVAKGEYVMFLDPDDWYEYNTVEIAYMTAKNNNAQAVHYNRRELDESTGKLLRNTNLKERFLFLYKYDLGKNPYYNYKDVKRRCFHSFDMAVPNRIYLTKFLKDNNIHFSQGRFAEDWLFTIGVLLKADKIFFVDKILYNYLIRKRSTSHTYHKDVMRIFDIVNEIKKFLIINDMYEELEEEYKDFKLAQFNYVDKLIPFYLRPLFTFKCIRNLTRKEYKAFKYRGNNFIENIFSVKNKRKNHKKYKVITILWIKFKIKKCKDA